MVDPRVPQHHNTKLSPRKAKLNTKEFLSYEREFIRVQCELEIASYNNHQTSTRFSPQAPLLILPQRDP